MSKYNKTANEPNKVWRQWNKPLRSIIFWGWNEKDEPSFLILYGTQKFAEEYSYEVEDSDIERYENILEDDVTYKSYAIFNGSQGHLPSFEAVNIEMDGGWYYNGNKDEFPKMYYKSASRVGGWRRNFDEGIVKEYVKFEEGVGITIPYFQELSYSELVGKVKSSNIDIENFKFAESPNEILNLSEGNKEYFESLCILMSNKNLYMRKKMLIELLDSNVDKEIYDCIFKVGSNELLSGLFLEAAKRDIKNFENEAVHILNNDIKYASESYVKGLKRCAEIYLNSINEEKRVVREKWIRDNVHEIDLPLIKIGGEEVSEGKKLNGARYRKLSLQSELSEYKYSYEPNSEGRWETVKTRNSDRYKSGPFNDGTIFDIKAFKNILQEAEAYKMADIIGKIAYYIDAPRLHYYFKGNELSRELRYFKKYIHRIIKFYAQNDKEKFMEVVKTLFTSYTEDDFLCKFKGNFQFNYFIRNILYADFKEKPPKGDWYNWQERFNWMSNDQLLKLEGRYECNKEIWDEHLEDVLNIALNAKISTVYKACYFILKESSKTNELIEKMSYEEIIKLTMASYEPLAEMFKDKLKERLSKEEKFNFNIMKALMDSDNDKLIVMAEEYYDNCNGHLTEKHIVELMFITNIDRWTSYICKCVKEIKVEEYFEFVKAMIDSEDRFRDVNMPKEITDTLSQSVNKILEISEEERRENLNYTLNEILQKGSMSEILENYLEEVIFVLSYDEIKKAELSNSLSVKLSNKFNRIINIVSSILEDNIPSNSVIIEVLETGASKTVKTLFEIIDVNEKELKERFSTLLIFLESDIEMLNERAKRVFRGMDEEQRIKMHKVIIDSPVEKVYKFGLEELKEVYGEYIPADFIRQMMEHTSPEVKAFISDKTENILKTLAEGNKDLFMYFAKTLLLLPNRVRKNKDDIYEALYSFAVKYSEIIEEVEKLLLHMGASNIIKDREKALVTLAKIRKELAV